MYLGKLTGLPSGLIKANLPEGLMLFQVILTAYMTYYLLRKYSDYLLSCSWKASFFRYLHVGVMWSIPLLAIQLITLAIPSFRDKLIDDYVSMRIISVKETTNTILVLFSVMALFGAVFEEFIFRGIFLQKMTHFLNKNLSVFIVAGVFGCFHLILGDMKFSDFFDSFLGSLFSGFAFVKTSSCISAVVPHLLNNAFCIGLILVCR
ncbi:MAG: CPBP family intramembrane metalloprotease [Deltaproteobacteria bacterium]|nr:CPBP family intramembrane metalloprotease [Deltaproteobacteria bacterium]